MKSSAPGGHPPPRRPLGVRTGTSEPSTTPQSSCYVLLDQSLWLEIRFSVKGGEFCCPYTVPRNTAPPPFKGNAETSGGEWFVSAQPYTVHGGRARCSPEMSPLGPADGNPRRLDVACLGDTVRPTGARFYLTSQGQWEGPPRKSFPKSTLAVGGWHGQLLVSFLRRPWEEA